MDEVVRDAERRAFVDPAESPAFWHAKQRACAHEFKRLGIFEPGASDHASEFARVGQVKVEICWGCHETRVTEGVPLCFWCDKPGGKEGLRGMAEPDALHDGRCHVSCAKAWKEAPE